MNGLNIVSDEKTTRVKSQVNHHMNCSSIDSNFSTELLGNGSKAGSKRSLSEVFFTRKRLERNTVDFDMHVTIFGGIVCLERYFTNLYTK